MPSEIQARIARTIDMAIDARTSLLNTLELQNESIALPITSKIHAKSIAKIEDKALKTLDTIQNYTVQIHTPTLV
jgi:hypothetical protein